MTASEPAELRDSLLARVAAVLSDGPREIEVDWRFGNVRILPEQRHGRSVLAVVTSANAVILYSVWPDQVPAEAEVAVVDYVTTANTEPSVPVLEYDRLRRVLAARCGIGFATMEFVDVIPGTVLFGLLWTALTSLEAAADEHAEAVAGLLGGR